MIREDASKDLVEVLGLRVFTELYFPMLLTMLEDGPQEPQQSLRPRINYRTSFSSYRKWN